MSLTISASAGEDSVCNVTKRASLGSVAPSSALNRSTNCAPSSGQCVTPVRYSDSQTGQNITLHSQASCQISFGLADVVAIKASNCRQTRFGSRLSKHAGLKAESLYEQVVS